MSLREIELPAGVPGRLFASAMPGRDGPLEDVLQAMGARGVTSVVCLAPPDEVARTSPAYHRALEDGALPVPVTRTPMPDFGVPDDRDAFLAEAKRAAGALRRGERIVIHCRAGIGRTGTFATAVLMALGLSREEAAAAVTAAGSRPEAPQQQELLRWAAQHLATR